MSRIVWYIGNFLMFGGIVLVGFAIFVGIGAGNMAQEYLYWALGGGAFMLGVAIRNSAE